MKKREITTLDEILSKILLMQLQKITPEAVEVRAYTGANGIEEFGMVVASKIIKDGMGYYCWDHFSRDFEPQKFADMAKDEILSTNEIMDSPPTGEKTTHQLDGKWVFEYGYEGKIPSKGLEDLLGLMARKEQNMASAVRILSREDLKETLGLKEELEAEYAPEGGA